MKARRYAKLLGLVAGVVAMFAVLSPAAQAETPNPGYEQFAGCPNPTTENSEVHTCVRAVITGGHFKMGSKEVPIEKPITLTGGVKSIFETSPVVFNSEGGLSKVKEKVPGGVIGLTGLVWLAEFLGVEALTLYAVTELAGTPEIFATVNAHLPVKVHLENTALGPNCYVGSNAKPIDLHLTTETTSPPPPNEPITGTPPNPRFEATREIQEELDGVYVDNAFEAPGASGCVLTLFGFLPINLNNIVNSQSGLPSPAGTNETVQNFDAEVVNAFFPYE